MRLPPRAIFCAACSPNAGRLGLAALAGEEVDANHRSPPLRSARPTATAHTGARSSTAPACISGGVERHLTERIEALDLGVEPFAHRLVEALDERGAAAQHHPVDAIAGRGRLVEVEGLLDLEQHVVGDRAQHRTDVLEAHAVDRDALLGVLSPLEGQPEFLLHRLGERVAADAHVAREHRLAAGDDVDVDGAGPDVDQRDDAPGVDAVVGLVGVLQREGVDVDHHRQAAGLADHAGVVGDLVLLRRHQQHVHRALALGGRRRAPRNRG